MTWDRLFCFALHFKGHFPHPSTRTTQPLSLGGEIELLVEPDTLLFCYLWSCYQEPAVQIAYSLLELGVLLSPNFQNLEFTTEA